MLHRLHERRERRLRWLFLTPEVERLVPELVAALATSAGEERSAVSESARLEALVVTADRAGWFAYLLECRTLLEAAARAGAPDALVERLALILSEQYLLAPTVIPVGPAEAEELQRLDALIARTRAHALTGSR